MGTPTWTPLATTTLGSSASSVTFSNIPNTYRDLIVIMTGTTSQNSDVNLRFNSDSGNNYSTVRAVGYGSSQTVSSSGTYSSISTIVEFGATQSNGIYQILDSSATDKHKSVLGRGSKNGSGDVEMGAGRWANTSAITSVTVLSTPGTFSSATVISLYGVIA